MNTDETNAARIRSMNAKNSNSSSAPESLASKQRKAFFRCLQVYRENKTPLEEIVTNLTSHPGKPQGFNFETETTESEVRDSVKDVESGGNEGSGNDEDAPGPPVKKQKRAKSGNR